jgi:hypothetical protein
MHESSGGPGLRRYPNPWVAVPVLLAGLIGWWIGGKVAGAGCVTAGCAGLEILGGVIGALVGAGGVLTVAVLAVRSLAEWAALTEEQKVRRRRRRQPPVC